MATDRVRTRGFEEEKSNGSRFSTMGAAVLVLVLAWVFLFVFRGTETEAPKPPVPKPIAEVDPKPPVPEPTAEVDPKPPAPPPPQARLRNTREKWWTKLLSLTCAPRSLGWHLPGTRT